MTGGLPVVTGLILPETSGLRPGTHGPSPWPAPQMGKMPG